MIVLALHTVTLTLPIMQPVHYHNQITVKKTFANMEIFDFVE